MQTFYTVALTIGMVIFVGILARAGYHLIYLCAYAFGRWQLLKRIRSKYVMNLTQEMVLHPFSKAATIAICLCGVAMAGLLFIKNIYEQDLTDPDKEILIPIIMVAIGIIFILWAATTQARFAYKLFRRSIQSRPTNQKISN